jgi:hypothetical protein
MSLHLCDDLIKVYLPDIPNHLLMNNLGIIDQPVDVHLLPLDRLAHGSLHLLKLMIELNEVNVMRLPLGYEERIFQLLYFVMHQGFSQRSLLKRELEVRYLLVSLL